MSELQTWWHAVVAMPDAVYLQQLRGEEAASAAYGHVLRDLKLLELCCGAVLGERLRRFGNEPAARADPALLARRLCWAAGGLAVIAE